MEMDKVGVFLTDNISDHLPHLQSRLKTKGTIDKIFLSPFDMIILRMTGRDNNRSMSTFFQDITQIKKISFSAPKRSIKVVNLQYIHLLKPESISIDTQLIVRTVIS